MKNYLDGALVNLYGERWGRNRFTRAAGAEAVLQPCRVDHGVTVWCMHGEPCEPDRSVQLHPLLYTKAEPYQPRRKKDRTGVNHSLTLRILARAEAGMAIREIARELRIHRDTVTAVLKTNQKAA